MAGGKSGESAAAKGPRKISAQRLGKMATDAGAGKGKGKVISPDTVKTEAWVRWKCQFGCGGYGSSLVCPPHTPTPSQTRQMLDGYERAILFESPQGQARKIAVKLERTLFLAGCHKALGLGAGPCGICKQCALDDGCRHPHNARPSMEAFGIDVFATARGNGFTIDVVRDHEDRQHYFGLVMVD